MYNWSTDTKRFKKTPELYERWKLEQLINFGLRGTKIQLKKLKKHWNSLNIDSDKRKYLEFLIWPKHF